MALIFGQDREHQLRFVIRALPTSQHHKHQLHSVFPGNPNKPAFSEVPGKTASRASAAFRFSGNPLTSQHHEHQLHSVFPEPNNKPASRASAAFYLFPEAPNKPTSRASAAFQLSRKTPTSQHHEHQLHSACSRKPPTKPAPRASAAVRFSRKPANKPASRASAAVRFSRKHPTSQHHEHQPHSVFLENPQQASIMSISCSPFFPEPPKKPASRASAAVRLARKPPTSQHHEHQLQSVFPGKTQQASITSISCMTFFPETPNKPASRASAAFRFSRRTPTSQHHKHQLQSVLPGIPNKPASRASAAVRLSRKPLTSQHHEHQLHSVFPGNPQQASIMSISCSPFFPETPNKPASRASAA